MISSFDSDQMLNISSARDLITKKSRKPQHTASMSLQKLNPLNKSNLAGIASLDSNGYDLRSTRNRYSNKDRQKVVFNTRPNSFERQQQFDPPQDVDLKYLSRGDRDRMNFKKMMQKIAKFEYNWKDSNKKVKKPDGLSADSNYSLANLLEEARSS